MLVVHYTKMVPFLKLLYITYLQTCDELFFEVGFLFCDKSDEFWVYSKSILINLLWLFQNYFVLKKYLSFPRDLCEHLRLRIIIFQRSWKTDFCIKSISLGTFSFKLEFMLKTCQGIICTQSAIFFIKHIGLNFKFCPKITRAVFAPGTFIYPKSLVNATFGSWKKSC